MSINTTINLYDADNPQKIQNINAARQIVDFYAEQAPGTGVLGVISPENPDNIFDTGNFIVNTNFSLPVYNTSLIQATLTIPCYQSDIYNQSELNRSPFAFVASIFEMTELVDNPAPGVDVPTRGDFVLFTQDDLPYKAGDKGGYTGSTWIRYPEGTPVDIPIQPSQPESTLQVSVEVQDTADASLYSSYSQFNSSTKITGVIANISTNGVSTVDVTPVFKQLTDKSNWKKNNNVNLIVRPTGVAKLNREPFTTVSSVDEMLALPTELPPNQDILESTARVETGSDVPLLGTIPVPDDYVGIGDRVDIKIAQGSDIWIDQPFILTAANLVGNSTAVTGVVVTRDTPYFGVSVLSGIITKREDVNIPIVTEGDYVIFTEEDSPYEIGDKGSYNGSTWIREPSINYIVDTAARSPSNFRLFVNFTPVPPDIVQNIRVESAFRSLDVFWEPPLDDGGSPVTVYNVQWKEDGTNDWFSLGDVYDTYTTIPGLTPQVYYWVRVRAVNAAGAGPYNTTNVPYAPNNTNPAPIGSLDFNSANPIRVRIRRDYKANWDAADPVLAIGEPGYELDTHFLKVGDGLTSWTGLETIEVPDSTINFPTPADTILTIQDNPAGDPVFTVNLTNNSPLSLVQGSGLTLDFDSIKQSVKFSLSSTFDPVFSGTISNPQSTGIPGTVSYDDKRIYLCVEQNQWKRILQDIPWFDFVPLTVSNFAGAYDSETKILSSGNILKVETDSDPYPALAGTPLVNDGFTQRGGFRGGYIPLDKDVEYPIEYRGGENTSNPQPIGTAPIAVTVNGVTIKSPSYAESIDIFPPPPNFTYNLVYWSSYFGMDDCNGLVMEDRQYIYYGSAFVSNCWNTPKFYEANTYFNNTDYQGDHMRHGDGHSKIVGLAFDGYPIYGPFGYTDPLDSSSAIKRMASSYRTKPLDTHRPPNYKYTDGYGIEDIGYPLLAGAFVEDYEYISLLGDLDSYNGRYCKTPDYPNGTYAYFLTFADDGLLYPAYPYIIGSGTREQRSVL